MTDKIIEYPYRPAMPQAANWLLNTLMNNQELLELATSWAFLQLEDQGFDAELIQALHDPSRHETLENTPVYNSYYREQTVWFRKLLTASAALI